MKRDGIASVSRHWWRTEPVLFKGNIETSAILLKQAGHFLSSNEHPEGIDNLDNLGEILTRTEHEAGQPAVSGGLRIGGCSLSGEASSGLLFYQLASKPWTAWRLAQSRVSVTERHHQDLNSHHKHSDKKFCQDPLNPGGNAVSV